ncbi:Alpha/Beta hydrolase protein [Mycena galopus ATCC 62051]|nr:Alpha/Beta hydrolase protein [Mycena galopus ATCC 62051]
MIICHAFTGSADVEDWWSPLMGKGKAFDPERFFIFCANVLGSPYGSASPITMNPDTGKQYGPEFPATTIRDDVWIHKRVLDNLGVNSVAVCIGSMAGMAVLEWSLCTPQGYIRHVIPMATSARHSAWCISWGEAQRQSIYSDPGYEDGFALLTYRSRDSFESRFGRRAQLAALPSAAAAVPTPPAVAAHNEGHHRIPVDAGAGAGKPPLFSAQTYLRYQGQKFTARFDANCYIHIARKLDTHDVARGRTTTADEDGNEDVARVLATLPPRALVMSVASDGLGAHPRAELVMIDSPDGHDGFLLEFAQINRHVLRFLRRELPGLYANRVGGNEDEGVDVSSFEVKKTSIFGEADVARW